MGMRSPFGRVKVGTILGYLAFAVLLIGTDRLLGRLSIRQTHAIKREQAEARSHLRQLQEETKQLNARRAEMELSGQFFVCPRMVAIA